MFLSRRFMLATAGCALCAGAAHAAFLPNIIDLGVEPGEEGTPFTRVYAGEGDAPASGNSAIAVADFNQDGFDDYAIGYGNHVPAGSGGASRGRVVVVYGGADADPERPLDQYPDATIFTNDEDNAQFGYSISAGDVTDDGLPDLIVGAPGALSGRGAVVLLHNALLATSSQGHAVSTQALDSVSGETRFIGPVEGGSYGTAVLCADLSGDGAAEIIGGAPNVDVDTNSSAGVVYVGFGQNVTLGNTINITSEAELYEVRGTANSRLGSSLAAGDVDGNGVLDLLVGAPGANMAYGFFSVDPGPTTIELSDSSVFPSILRLFGYTSLGFAIATGYANADGMEDMLFGIPQHSPESGTENGGAILLAGRDNLIGANLDLTIWRTAVFWGATPESALTHQRYGATVEMGDVNGDGFADVILGAPFAPGSSESETLAGRTVVVYMNNFLPGRELEIGGDTNLVGAEASDFIGSSLNAQGDMNGDGRADLVIASGGGANPESNGTGNVFALYGDGNANSATFTADLISGDTQTTGLGGALAPVSRFSIRFTGGSGDAVSVTTTRNINALENIGNGTGSNVAPIHWNVSTTRTAWMSARLIFDCPRVVADTFDPALVRLFQADDPAGPWTEVAGATYDATANRITAETSTLGYFAVLTTQPVITLTGGDVTLESCSQAWAEPGFTALAFDGTDLTPQVVVGGDVVDDTVPGVYTITYDVDDSFGNAAPQVTRAVTIEDTVAPIFEGDSVTIECGDSFEFVPSIEDCEVLSNEVVITGTYDTSTPGTYNLTLNVTDSAGNVAEEGTAEITVVDTRAPDVQVVGDEVVEINCGDEYVELGATATDACDANVPQVQVSGFVNANVAGNYTLTYSVSDNAGNLGTTTRLVRVEDNDVPVINLGFAYIETQCGFSPNLPNYTVTDCTPNLASAVVVEGIESIDEDTPGSYFVTYNVTDPFNNVAEEKVLEVKIEDTVSPEITILGENPLTIECGGTYTEAGATATDSCSGVDGEVQVVSNEVNTDAAGTYQVRYQVFDLAGNIRQNVRTVEVVGLCGTGILEYCPTESTVSQLPADSSYNMLPFFSEEGAGQIFEFYTSPDNPPLAGITWWGKGLSDGVPCERNPNSFRVSFHDTTLTQTGTIPANAPAIYFEDLVPTVEDTGALDIQGNPILRYTAQFAQPVRLYEGQCCITLGVSILGLSNPDCFFYWQPSPQGDDIYHYGSLEAPFQGGGNFAFCLEPAAIEGEGEPSDAQHSADWNGSGELDLTEVMRVVQLYNVPEFGCAFGTEDGYEPYSESGFCGAHASDYAPQDWKISLSELLRLIQFYSLGGYEWCPDENTTEDGYCPPQL